MDLRPSDRVVLVQYPYLPLCFTHKESGADKRTIDYVKHYCVFCRKTFFYFVPFRFIKSL